MNIRVAHVSERTFLSDLAFRSKSHWPYERAALERYRPQLELHPEDIARGAVFVGVDAGQIVGFYALSAEPNQMRLYFLFVVPELIGRGYGKALWRHALESARARGWPTLTFYADRFAVDAFYQYQNCRAIGVMASGLGPLTELQVETSGKCREV